MGTINLDLTGIQNGEAYPIDATDVTDAFTTIEEEINGNLDNDNIDGSAAIEESKIDFDAAAGHNHDGTDSLAVPLAVAGNGDATAGSDGTMKYKTGLTGALGAGDSEAVSFAGAFTDIPLIKIYSTIGNVNDSPVTRTYMLVSAVTTAGFTASVLGTYPGADITIRWVAIGI
jgi:hypothetical protein